MFDVGFSELLVIGVVALVVVGPERLPKVARTLGHMVGRLQRYVNEVKADINREIELDELRKIKGDMQGAVRDFERSIHQTASEVEGTMRANLGEVQKALSISAEHPTQFEHESPSTGLGPPETVPIQPTLPGLEQTKG